MKVGDIFIQLGFEVTGTAGAQNFDAIIQSITHNTSRLVETVEDLRQEFVEQFEGMKKPVERKTQAVKKDTEAAINNTKETKKQTESYKPLITQINKARMIFLGLAGAIVFTTQKAAAYAQQLHVFSNVTGLDTQRLQQWEQQAAAVGITADETAATFRNLQKLATDVMLGQGNTKPWAFFGLDARANVFDTMTQLAGKLEKFRTPLGSRMAEELGLSDQFISMLRELKDMPAGDKGLLLSEKEMKRLRDFNFFFLRTMDTVKREMRKLGLAIAPMAEFFMYAFQRMAHALNFVSQSAQRLNDAMGGRFFQMLAMGALALSMYLFPVAASLVIIAAMVEDVVTYMEGGKSVLGFWIDQFSTLRDILESIPALIATIVDAVTFGQFTDSLGKMTQGVAGYLKYLFNEGGASIAADRRIPDLIAGKSLSDLNYASESRVQAHERLGGSSVTNNVSIQIDGAKDPAAVARETAAMIQRLNANALFQQPLTEGAK